MSCPRRPINRKIGAGDDQIAPVFDPFSGQEVLEQAFVQVPGGAPGHVFRHRAHMAQFGRAHAGLEPLARPGGDLAAGGQAQSFGMAQRRRPVLRLKFAKGADHASGVHGASLRAPR